MIPADVVSRIKLANDLVTAPAAAIDQVKDALSGLTPGQRVFAEIQAALPNGTYRAMVAQREVILSLPNAAKKGDSLELEVIENDGKLALALLSGKKGEAESQQSVSASLSRTGQLIGDLLSPPGKEGQKPQPAALNGNLPLINAAPAKAADLIPILKQALAQSGMFYESHQAKWAEGQLPTAQLMQEPQGQFSDLATYRAAQAKPDHNPFTEALNRPIVAPAEDAIPARDGAQTRNETPDIALKQASDLAQTAHRGSPAVAPELAPLVQQQLEALASNHFAWQGQVWPKQNMEWEITDERDPNSQDETEHRWQTQLTLRLPLLGEVIANLRLQGENQISLNIKTDSPDSEVQLALGGPALNQQMSDAGLDLIQFGVSRANPNDTTPA